MGTPYIYNNKLSDCCGAPCNEDTMICSECKEHCEIEGPEEDENEAADKLFKELQEALQNAVEHDNKKVAHLCHTGLSHWFYFYVCELEPEQNTYHELAASYLEMSKRAIK